MYKSLISLMSPTDSDSLRGNSDEICKRPSVATTYSPGWGNSFLYCDYTGNPRPAECWD
jgi:hypothetical protein